MIKGVPTFEDWMSRLLGGGCAGAKSGFNEKMASTSICQINEMSFFFLFLSQFSYFVNMIIKYQHVKSSDKQNNNNLSLNMQL